MTAIAKNRTAKNKLKIFSEMTWPIMTKLWWNGPWVVPFQKCIHDPAAITKNRKLGK